MTNSVLIDIESSDSVALINLDNCKYEIIKHDRNRLCNGYGYFKAVNGVRKLIALLAHNEKLYLFFDKLYELDAKKNSVELKYGFFINELKLLENEDIVLSIKFKQSSYDAGVIEGLYELFKNKNLVFLRIKNTIRILSEVDPVERSRIDRECMLDLENAKKCMTAVNENGIRGICKRLLQFLIKKI